MHKLQRARRNPSGRASYLLGAILLLGLLLSACGYTDKDGTNFKIVIEPLVQDEGSLAPIGALQLGEVATVSYLITFPDKTVRDRTAQARFYLSEPKPEHDATAFTLTLSPDLAARPHTVEGHVADASVMLCAEYHGVEVIDPSTFEPVCMALTVIVPSTD